MNKKNKIAVIIVSYNGLEYLPDCLNSLKKQAFLPNQIIIVDNNSQDDSVEYVKSLSPHQKFWHGSKIDLIVNQRNQGFAQANNQGIELALGEGADYVFLLNQDTVLKKDCLEKLVQAIVKEENVFALQPLVLWWSGLKKDEKKDLIQTSGDKIHYLGFGFSKDFKKPLNQFPKYSPDNLPKITYGSGSALFIKASLLKKVGFLDKDLFLYHEDLDLCLRARFLGYEIKLVPWAQLYHKYTEGVPKNRWYWSERNRLLTLLKFYKLPTLILIFPAWLFMEIGVWGFSLITGWCHLKFKSYFTCLCQIPKTLLKRKKIQKKRKIKDCQLAEFLEAEFNFTGFDNQIIKKIVNPILGTYWKIVRRIIFW